MYVYIKRLGGVYIKRWGGVYIKRWGGGFPSHHIVVLQDYIIQHHQQCVLELDANLSPKELFKVSDTACIHCTLYRSGGTARSKIPVSNAIHVLRLSIRILETCSLNGSMHAYMYRVSYRIFCWGRELFRKCKCPVFPISAVSLICVCMFIMTL